MAREWYHRVARRSPRADRRVPLRRGAFLLAMLYSLFRPLLFALDPETGARRHVRGSRRRGEARARADGRCRIRRRRRSRRWDSSFPTASASPPASTRTPRTSTASPRSASASSSAAPSRRARSPAIRSRASSACPRREALINRLGFNNDGVERFLANASRARYRGILGLNIGKNFDTPNERAVDDYLACLRAVYARASYVAVNISSPNTKGLRELQHEASLAALLDRAQVRAEGARASSTASTRRSRSRSRPTCTPAAIEGIARLLVRHRIDGVIATNTTVARDGGEGRAARRRGRRALGPAAARAGDRRDPHARAARSTARCRSSASAASCRGADAKEKIDAGATLVQIYTGLIYRGPDLVAECARALAAPVTRGQRDRSPLTPAPAPASSRPPRRRRCRADCGTRRAARPRRRRASACRAGR